MSNENDVIKCASCGADLVYDPAKGALFCAYCNGTRVIERKIPLLRDFLLERANDAVSADVAAYDCPNCGGKVELSNFATAVKCPFCGATNIEKKENMAGLKPDSILPFLLPRDVASAKGKKWLKRRIFAPSSLKKNFKADKFNGIYVPMFTFSSRTYSQYAGRLGETRTRVVGSGKNQRTETYTEWYHVSGAYNKDYFDIAVESTTQMTQNELDKILPYDINNAEAYNREYVAGFLAERYDTPIDDSFNVAKGKIDKDIRDEIIAKYHADKVDYLNVTTNYDDIKFRYMLSPIWVCAYNFKNAVYRFIVNGRSGKVVGKTPKSPIRVSIAVILALGAIGALIWLFAFSGLVF